MYVFFQKKNPPTKILIIYIFQIIYIIETEPKGKVRKYVLQKTPCHISKLKPDRMIYTINTFKAHDVFTYGLIDCDNF